MKTKLIKQARYKQSKSHLNNNISKANISREVIEINIRSNNKDFQISNDEEDKNNLNDSIKYHKHKMRNMNLNSIGNIEEEKYEEDDEEGYESRYEIERTPEHFKGRPISLINKFDNPQSLASSENPNRGMRLNSSSYDSKSSSALGHRHHSNTENLLGNLTHKVCNDL